MNKVDDLEFARQGLIEWLETKGEPLRDGHRYVPLSTAMLAVNSMKEAAEQSKPWNEPK